MKVWKILQSLENYESCMARLYGAVHRHYTGNPEIADFFARMRDEELSHRDIVRYQRRIMVKSSENYMDVQDYDQDALDRTIRTVADLIAREPNLTLSETLRSAVVMETAATEQHCRSVVGRTSPALGKIVQSLGSCDAEHAARLDSLARSQGEDPAWRTA